MIGPAIDAHNLTVRYGEVLALDGVSLSVDPATVCGLVGMNGSGKSTLFKAIMGLVRPDQGQVTVRGHSPHVARKSGLIGYVPQSEDVDWTFPLSVRDVVMMGRYGHQSWTRRPRPADREAVRHALERVELTDLADRQIGALSGGQRKARVRGPRHCPGCDDLAPRRTVRRCRQALRGDDHRIAARARLRGVDSSGLHPWPAQPASPVRRGDLADMRKVLMHGPPAEVLKPENLALAFGVDVLDRSAAA